MAARLQPQLYKQIIPLNLY